MQPDASVAKCARGDKYSFFVKPGATADSNLIIEFQGGGICWGRRRLCYFLGFGAEFVL